MPRLNSKLIPTMGYMRSWFDDDRFIQYKCGPTECYIQLSDGTNLAGPIAAQYVYARGGKWAAEVTGGVRFGDRLLPGSSIGRNCDPLGPDSTLVVKRVRDSFGPWGFVDGPDFGGDCQAVTNLGGGQALWIEGDWKLSSNFGFPHAGIRCYSYRWDGANLLYQSADTGELVLNGRVISPTGDYYRPDFAALPSGGFLVVYSPTEGENSVVRLIVGDLAGLPRVGTTQAPSPVNPPVIPYPVPPKEIPPVSYNPNVTSTWTRAQLQTWVHGMIVKYNSSDNEAYWVEAIETHPSGGTDDVGYWEGRIATGDGAGKGPGSVQAPPEPVPSLTIEQLQAAISEALKPVEEKLNIQGSQVEKLAQDLLDLSSYCHTPREPKEIETQTSRVWGHSHSVKIVV